LASIVKLFRAYASSLEIDLSYQGFEAEMEAMPGKYAPPAGELLLRQARPVWDGAAVSDTVPRHVRTVVAVSGAVCPESLLVTGWELALPPGCGIRVPVELLQAGWPVRAIVGWSGQSRLRIRVIPAPRWADGGTAVTDTARDGVTRTFAYLTPRLGDREVIVVLENVGVADIHISAFHFGFF